MLTVSTPRIASVQFLYNITESDSCQKAEEYHIGGKSLRKYIIDVHKQEI